MSFEGAFNVDNWHREAVSLTVRNGIKTRRWGMRVTVYTGPNAGDYVLSYGLVDNNIQNNANWLKVADIGQTWGGGGGGTITGAENGLSVSGTDVVLGGPLLNNTTVLGDGNSIYFSGNNQFAADGDELYLTSNGLMQFVAIGNFQLDGDAVVINAISGAAELNASVGDVLIGANTDINLAANADINIVSNNNTLIQTAFALDLESTGGGITFTTNAGNIEGYATGGQFAFTSTDGIGNYSVFGLDASTPSALWEVSDLTLTTQISLGVSIGSGPAIDLTLPGGVGLNGDEGIAGYVWTSNGPGVAPTYEPAGGGGSPAGADTEIQINDSGVFGAGKVFIPADGELLLGDTGLSGSFRQITVEGSDPDVQLFISSKGAGEASLVSPGGQVSLYAGPGSSFLISAEAGAIQRQSAGSIQISFGSGTSNNGFKGSQGDVTSRNGASLYYEGGDADASGGNGNGGNVRLISGLRNFSGSGVDGNVEFVTNEGNISLFELNPNYQSGSRIVYFGDAIAVPAGNAAGGGYLYSEAGALKWRGSAGTVTTIAPA